MRVATWNVNSLKVRLPHVLQWLGEREADATPIDLLCLQELKLPDDRYPLAELDAAGYASLFTGQKTYNGVAILARKASVPEGRDVVKNIPGFADEQQRIVAATYDVDGGPVRVISAYIPNGQALDSDKFVYKLRWLEALQAWLTSEMAANPRLMLLGDFNIAPEDRDVHDPKKWEGQNLVSPEERAAFRAMQGAGLVDAFRMFEQEDKLFSWWDYRMFGFKRNAGLRIDHIMLSPELAKLCESCHIDRVPRTWEQPSDHTPVVAALRDA